MPPINQQNLTPAQLQSIYDILSTGRFGTYLVAAGHDHERALALYVWNALVGEAFYLPSQAVEVGLRNRINHALTTLYGNNWWDHVNFQSVIDQARQADLAQVKSRIHSRQLPLVNGQVVAGLSFGFWAGMLQKRYNPAIWSQQLKSSFPDLPANVTRGQLSAEVKSLLDLRNRISHHEPLIKRNLMDDHSRVMRLLNWLCPVKGAWLKPYCRAPSVLRQKP